jgi:hypothetical protein
VVNGKVVTRAKLPEETKLVLRVDAPPVASIDESDAEAMSLALRAGRRDFSRRVPRDLALPLRSSKTGCGVYTVVIAPQVFVEVASIAEWWNERQPAHGVTRPENFEEFRN